MRNVQEKQTAIKDEYLGSSRDEVQRVNDEPLEMRKWRVYVSRESWLLGGGDQI